MENQISDQIHLLLLLEKEEEEEEEKECVSSVEEKAQLCSEGMKKSMAFPLGLALHRIASHRIVVLSATAAEAEAVDNGIRNADKNVARRVTAGAVAQ